MAVLFCLTLVQTSCSKSESFFPNGDLVGDWYMEFVPSYDDEIIIRREYSFTKDGNREVAFKVLEKGTKSLLGYQLWSVVSYTTKLDVISYGSGYFYKTNSTDYLSKENLLLGKRTETERGPNTETYKLIESKTKLDIRYLTCDDVGDCPGGILLNKKK